MSYVDHSLLLHSLEYICKWILQAFLYTLGYFLNTGYSDIDQKLQQKI